MAGGSLVGSAEQLYVRAPTGYTKVERMNIRYIQCILALDVNRERDTNSRAVKYVGKSCISIIMVLF
jgi:hypothetical protein